MTETGLNMTCPVKLIKKTILIASLIFFTFSLLTTSLFGNGECTVDAHAADVEHPNKPRPAKVEQNMSDRQRSLNVQVQQKRIIDGLERIEEKLEY